MPGRYRSGHHGDGDQWAETGKWWEDAEAARARRYDRAADDIPPDDPEPDDTDPDQLPLLDIEGYQSEVRRLNEERMRQYIEGGD